MDSKTAALLIALAVLAAAGNSVADQPAFLVGGIQVHERDHDRWTETLLDVGMNTVAVTVYAKQGAWDSSHLWFEDEEPSVLDEIRTAKAKGLAVVLVLRVAVDHAFPENQFIWHGMIMPSSPEEIRAWFANYERFVLKWARVSQREGVDLLGLGSEMKALSATLPIGRRGNLKSYYGYYWYQRLSRKRAQRFADQIEQRHLWTRGYPDYPTLEQFLEARFRHTTAWSRQAALRPGGRTLHRINQRRRQVNQLWIDLIRRTREVYEGKLTYAANFDNYRNVGFWPQLDLIGINSYFSLRANMAEASSPEQQTEHFTREWTSILGQIEEFKRDQGIEEMPFVFTELGYTFRRHSTVEPWAHGGFSIVGWKGKKREFVVWAEQPVDYEERRLAIVGLHEAHRTLDSGLTGILYWKLSTDREHEAIEPFVLHVGADSKDGLQQALTSFATTNH